MATSRTFLRYELDEENRLIVEDPTDALRPRRVIEGRVSVDRRNRLGYEPPAPVLGDAGPRRLVLDGTWSLTDTHTLALTVHDTERHARSVLYVKGALVQAQADALIVAGTGRKQCEALDLAGRGQRTTLTVQQPTRQTPRQARER